MSEPYSETADVETARRLLDFGDDYRNFLDSQSDCASSMSAVRSSSPPVASSRIHSVCVIAADFISRLNVRSSFFPHPSDLTTLRERPVKQDFISLPSLSLYRAQFHINATFLLLFCTRTSSIHRRRVTVIPKMYVV